MGYHRLNRGERYQIQALVVSKAPIREMARVLGRSPSTISREIRRNRPNGILYRASKACCRAQLKRAGLQPVLEVCK